jgi:hypothetical protein
VNLVRESFEENETISWTVEMERGVGFVTEKVKKGLPLTRKNLKFEEGMSKVTLRSLKEEITCFSFPFGRVEDMVRSGWKTWLMTAELENRLGYDIESEEFDDLMR